MTYGQPFIGTVSAIIIVFHVVFEVGKLSQIESFSVVEFYNEIIILITAIVSLNRILDQNCSGKGA
jgi:hypothetical protein